MIIIGEKINGTIPATGAAIEKKDSDFIASLALRQSEAGADFIDVCASTTPELEVETMQWLIDIVQSTTETPLSIDSPNPKVIKEVFGLANKPGLINSVSLEGEKINIIFPLIAATEWQCVALLCDNNGIPSDVETRMKIAVEIVKQAEAAGIAYERLHIDPLVMSLPTDGTSMTKFVDCCHELCAEFPGIHITSGLSNISFGLPLRKSVNMAFLVLAINAGMDSAIIDPLDRDMLAAMLAAEALLEKDRHCRKYTTAYRKGRIGKPKE